MSTPIDRLFDQARMHCTICGAAKGQCDCWTKCDCGWSYRKGESCRNPDCANNSGPLRSVTLECPKCHRSQQSLRDPSDPPRTVTIRIQCPECVDGEPAAPIYIDTAGNQL